MTDSEIWAVEHALTWKDDPSRLFEAVLAVFETESRALEWLKAEQELAEFEGNKTELRALDGELVYETSDTLNRLNLILLPFYRDDSDTE